MMNRWQGNSGRVQRLPEGEQRGPRQPRQSRNENRAPEPKQAPARTPQSNSPGRSQSLPPLFMAQPGKKQGGLLSGLDGLKRLIPGKAEELETEDIILLLILYLMYRESGDSELLMIMGAMFLL